MARTWPFGEQAIIPNFCASLSPKDVAEITTSEAANGDHTVVDRHSPQMAGNGEALNGTIEYHVLQAQHRGTALLGVDRRSRRDPTRYEIIY